MIMYIFNTVMVIRIYQIPAEFNLTNYVFFPVVVVGEQQLCAAKTIATKTSIPVVTCKFMSTLQVYCVFTSLWSFRFSALSSSSIFSELSADALYLETWPSSLLIWKTQQWYLMPCTRAKNTWFYYLSTNLHFVPLYLFPVLPLIAWIYIH